MRYTCIYVNVFLCLSSCGSEQPSTIDHVEILSLAIFPVDLEESSLQTAIIRADSE